MQRDHYNHHNCRRDKAEEATATATANMGSRQQADPATIKRDRMSGGDKCRQRRQQQRQQDILSEITPSNKRKKQVQRTAIILWSIFLYGLMQIASNQDNKHNSSHLLKRNSHSAQQHQENPITSTTLSSASNSAITASLACKQSAASLMLMKNDEESTNDNGCSEKKLLQQQLCSSQQQLPLLLSDQEEAHHISSSQEQTEEEEEKEAPFIKSTLAQKRPLFSTFLPPSVIHSSLLQIFDKLTNIINAGTNSLLQALAAKTTNTSQTRVWLAEAATIAAAAAGTEQAERGIVVLNSTNFSRELLQNRLTFPHIKLIEFYVAYCGFCVKFKPTYISLAKEIYSWRNVIRPSMIDVSTNLPVARSWHVDAVPTLRAYPPLTNQIATKIDKQLSKMTKEHDKEDNDDDDDDTQKYLYTEYSAAKPTVLTLEPSTYLNNIPQFKTVLLEYINSYVRSSSSSPSSDGSSNSNNNNYIPETWPNLRPVTEESLSKLLANHPRQELFLMIQGPAAAAAHQSQSTSEQANAALQVMLELSSSASWKAVRYVKASENKALVEDVILQLKKLSRQPTEQTNEQVEMLESFLTDKPSTSKSPPTSNIILIHTDDSHSLVKKDGSSFAFISAMTSQDLLSQQQQQEQQQISGGNQRVRRADEMVRRSAESPISSSDLQAELIAKHISHTYTETKEDRKFMRAINAIYRDISLEPEDTTMQPEETTNKAPSSDAAPATATAPAPATSLAPPPQHQISSSPQPSYTESSSSSSSRANYVDGGGGDESSDDGDGASESLFAKLHNLLFNKSSSSSSESSADPDSTRAASSGDYFDKIKAIRYIFFNEIPRTSFADKSLSEQQEKLNILLNLVSVIKSYFPMADSSSIQFMDGVHTYLLKQQSKSLSVNNQQQQPDEQQQQQRGVLLDVRAFKQELKRLESEDKRLPEVKEFRHCAKGGYPCALWRLFHTLTAFEYKKLNQIRLIPTTQHQQQQHQQTSTGLQQHDQQPAELISSLSNVAPAPEPMSSNGGGSSSSSTINSTSAVINVNSDVPSPGERLVSPPSTTTSLSLTIAGPSTSSSSANGNNQQQSRRITEADLPTPVLLVMRDYITNFFGCTECSKNFQQESADLSLERIRHQEPAEFSILWLWETHNRVNKRLSVNRETNPLDNPKMWFPSYGQCPKCYKKPPSYLRDDSIAKDTPEAIFYESIDWNRLEVLDFLANEYTKQPLESSNLFASHLPYEFGYILAGCLCLLVLTLFIRCFTQYVERQRRHKANLLNGGNGAHYSLELQPASR